MRRMTAVLPILWGFICGFNLTDFLRAIDLNAGIHSATDLYLWIIVPVAGVSALVGAWRAFVAAGPARPAA